MWRICLTRINTDDGDRIHQTIPYSFEVQIWRHNSIDGYASDTSGLGLGQKWALYCKTGSIGTLGHMPPPLQLQPTSYNPSLMRSSHCLLCPLALWIRKVLLWLSDQLSNIDLNNLTLLIPGGFTFSPQPLNSTSRSIILVACVHGRAGNLPSLPTRLPPVQIN